MHRRAGGIGLGLILIVATALLALSIRSSPQLSATDEQEHLDYLDKAGDGHLVRLGETLGPVTLREYACRGLDGHPDLALPPCTSRELAAVDFPAHGFNTVSEHPPLYYLVNGPLARVLTRVGAVESSLTAGRLVDALWLWVAMTLLWMLLAEGGVSPLARLVVASLLLATPVVIEAETKVNPDVTAMATGAAVLLLALRWERGRSAWWWVVLAGILAAATKETNLIGVGLAAGYLVIRSCSTPSPTAVGWSPRAFRWVAAATCASALVTTAAWQIAYMKRALVPESANPLTQQYYVDSLSLSTILGEGTRLLTPVHQPFLLEPFRGHGVAIVLMTLTDAVLVGALIGGIAFGTHTGRTTVLATATVLVLLATGPVLAVVEYASQHVFFATPPRYGLSALPACGLLLGEALNKRLALIAVGLFSLLSLAYSVARLAAG